MNDLMAPPNRMIRAAARVMRWLSGLVLAALVLLGLVWGALHLLIVPRIAELRPWLETAATRTLGLPVRVGAIVALPGTPLPGFELRNVALLNPAGEVALELPRVLVSLSLGSLARLDFDQLFIDRPTLTIQRLADGRLWVAGLEFSGTAAGDTTSAANWFFSQREFVIRDGTVRWIDGQRDADPLQLGQVDFVMRNGARHHDLRVKATPPTGWGERFELMGQFQRPLFSTNPGRWQDWSGQLYADFPHIDISRLRQYATLGVDVREGKGGLRAWVDVTSGAPAGGVADLALLQATAVLGEGLEPLQLRFVTGRVGGKQTADAFEFFTERLQFQTESGLRWPGGNVAVSHVQARGQQAAKSELRADRLDISALGQIATRLPLGTATLATLNSHPVSGLVETLSAQWEGDLNAPAKYAVRARVSQMALDALPARGIPGLNGATLDVELDQSGGKGQLVIDKGGLDLPGVFEDPVLPLRTLQADAVWQVQGERIRVNKFNARFTSADADGEFSGSWRTSDAATSPSRSRFPGVLDLQGRFSRADGTRVHRYLPLGIPPDVRHYVRDAITAGQASDIRVRVRGDLHDIPFADTKQGEFYIGGKVRNVVFAFVPPSAQPAGDLPWPVLADLSGELIFDRATMLVKGASSRMQDAPGLKISQVEAKIPDYMNTVTVVVGVEAKGPLTQVLGVVKRSPLGALTGKALDQATATGDAGYRLHLNLPIATLARSRVSGSVTLGGNDIRILPDTPLLARARGQVAFSENGFAVTGGQVRMLGGDLRLEGGTRALPAVAGNPPEILVTLRGQGNFTAEGLRQAGEMGFLSRLAQQASGGAAYNATLGIRRGVSELSVSSNLQGLALTLPAPLNKPADSALPMRFESALLAESLKTAPGTPPRLQDRLQLDLGRLLSMVYVRDLSGAVPRVMRGAIGVGLAPDESAPMPDEGVVANIKLGKVNVDAWEAALSRAAGAPLVTVPVGTATAADAGPAVSSYLPTALAVRASELQVAGRTLNDLVIGGGRQGQTWRANLDAKQLNGYLEYRQPSAGNDGRLYGRLSRMDMAPSGVAEVENVLDRQPAAIPALDIIVDDLQMKGRKLGRVEVEAVNRGGGVGVDGAAQEAREWRLNKLNITVPEARFTATGNWAVAAPLAGEAEGAQRRRTAMNFQLDMADSGALLTRFGLKDAIRNGKGKLEGQVSWDGSPFSPDVPTLGGQFNLNVENGQFLKADPGLAKLLGVLSLQSLPRRLTLDFRDVFSEGFAFDFVRGDVAIAQGVATTNNLQMKGVSVAALLDGRADIARETQDLRVVVVPEINALTASLVMTAINPAIGLGTLLAQLVLKGPLAQAATQEFRIDGSWSDPQVTKVARTGAMPAGSATAPDRQPESRP